MAKRTPTHHTVFSSHTVAGPLILRFKKPQYTLKNVLTMDCSPVVRGRTSVYSRKRFPAVVNIPPKSFFPNFSVLTVPLTKVLNHFQLRIEKVRWTHRQTKMSNIYQLHPFLSPVKKGMQLVNVRHFVCLCVHRTFSMRSRKWFKTFVRGTVRTEKTILTR